MASGFDPGAWLKAGLSGSALIRFAGLTIWAFLK
jgi:hypothetical protein